MQIILINSTELTNERITYLSNLFELPTKYDSIFHKHKLYIADNNNMPNCDLI